MRKFVYELLEGPNRTKLLPRAFDVGLMALILLNAVQIVLQSIEGLPLWLTKAFDVLERISLVVFLVEYILRLWISPLRYGQGARSFLRFVVSPLGLIDLMAILPSSLPAPIRIDLRFLRLFRLLRLLRVFHWKRLNQAFALLDRVIQREKELLLSTFLLIGILLISSATLIYYVEHEVQPEAFSNIPAALWWAVSTITTVGYGDVYPVTLAGKILAGIVILLGVIVVALPTAIISSGLIQEASRTKKYRISCPHCGKSFETDRCE